MKKLFLLIAVIAAIGCQQSHASKQQEVAQPTDTFYSVKEHPIKDTVEAPYPYETLADEFADIEHRPEWMDSCLPALYPDTWLDTVLAHPKITRKRETSDDGCVLLTISMLTSKIISGECSQCLIVLNRVASVSDGYVSEYLVEMCRRLYDDAFETFINYLASLQGDNDRLLSLLTDSFYYEMLEEDTPSPEVRRSEIVYDIQQKMKGRPEAQQQVLKKLEKKVKEITYD